MPASEQPATGLRAGEVTAARFLLAASVVLVGYLAVVPLDLPQLTGADDKVGHLAAFAGLAFLADFAFPACRYGVAKWLPLVAYGATIEGVQYFLPHRSFSLLDLAADALGLLLYGAGVPLLRRLPILRRRWAHG